MSYFTPPAVSNNTQSAPSRDISTNSVKKPGARTDKQMSDRASSIGNWVRSKLPSRRPERGERRRDDEYSEQTDGRDMSLNYPGRRATDVQQSRRSDTGDSDLLTIWNTPKDLPDPERVPAGIPRRVFSSVVPKKTLSNDSRRRVSWLAPADGKLQLARLPVEPATASEIETDIDFNLEATGRRLTISREDIEAKKELRRRRRHLKESGDYLGVQGINPDTGQLDVITPTDSGNSSASQETTQKINALRQARRNAKSNYKETAQRSEREIQKIILEKERQKMKKSQREKDNLNRLNQGLLKWRRHTRQWSSAQEPDLSPIAQSHRSGASTSSTSLPL